MSDLLESEAINSLLLNTMFADKVRVFSSIDSTNTLAMREGANGAPHGSVYVAEEQTAGRGRGSHAWHSEPHSGLYISVLLHPRMAPADALWLSLAAGLAVQVAIKNAAHLDADIRWPNDLLFGKRKFAGILTEMNAEATRVRYAVIGIGMNVSHGEFPPELREQATSLRLESDREISRQEVLVEILQSLHAEVSLLFSEKHFEHATKGILARMEEGSTWIRGKRVIVNEEEGYTGVTAGLDARGFLRVETADGVRTVLSGGVREASTKR